MRKLFNRKWIIVFEVADFHTSWGYVYRLYRYGNTYYTDESDGTDDVIELGEFDNDEKAIEIFKEYMEDLEKEICEGN